MKFRELLSRTHFVKDYTNRKPRIESIIKAIESANDGPMAGNLQPIQYLIVENPDSISLISQACQQPFVIKAPYIIIIISDSTQMERLYGDKSEKYLKQNIGFAVQNFILQLAELGISSALVAPFSEITLHNHFNIPEEKEIELIITAGEGSGKIMKRKNPSLINKIFYGSYGNKFYKPFPKITRKDI
ncbi:MAG: nitroreductase family protein [Nanoarchaeota archaeon]